MSASRAVSLCLLVAGAVVGGLLSLVTAFFVPTRVAGVSLGVVLTVLTIGPYSHLVGRALRSAPAAAVPALGWFVVTMTAAGKRPEGDLIVTGSLAGLAFLILGTVSATLGIGTVRAAINRRARRLAEAPPEPAPED